MARSRDRAAAAAVLALLLCACAAGRRDRPCGGAALQELLRTNYSAASDGLRSCPDGWRVQDPAAAFQFQAPGLELIRCVSAEAAGQAVGGDDAYVVLLSGAGDSPGRYKCAVCDSRWYPADRDPLVQRPEVECGVPGAPELRLEGHPAGGAAGARLEGVRCHPAYRKGCDRGYGWCHGRCCRAEALFYYPQLQQPIGAGRLLTAKSAGPREAPLLRRLTAATKSAGSDC